MGNRVAKRCVMYDKDADGCKEALVGALPVGSLRGITWYRSAICGENRDRIRVYASISDTQVIIAAELPARRGDDLDNKVVRFMSQINPAQIGAQLNELMNKGLNMIRTHDRLTASQRAGVYGLSKVMGMNDIVKNELRKIKR